MCTNHRLINTKNGKPLVVPCGVCPSCLQSKANRITSLIRNNNVYDDDYCTLFITLTYDNRFIPYFRKSEVLNFLDEKNIPVNIYRHESIQLVKSGKNSTKYKKILCGKIDEIEFQDCPDDEVKNFRGIRKISDININSRIYRSDIDKVGILYKPDIQNFFKRLKVNYERDQKKQLDLSYFYVGEYGPTTLRPHFHALLRIKCKDFAAVRDATFKSWKFHNWQKFQEKNGFNKAFQIAKNASSYVASYVNQHSYLPKVYNQKAIVPKCSHTIFYGLNNVQFSLDSLVQAIRKRDLHYNVSFNVKDSVYLYSFLLPSYVISYYFPKFKGFNKCTSYELYEIYKNPYKLLQYSRRLGYTSHFDKHDFWYYIDKMSIYSRSCQIFQENEYSKHNDLVLNLHLLLSSRARFMRDWQDTYLMFPVDRFVTYAILASEVWTIRASNSLIDTYKNYSDDERYQFSVYDRDIVYKSQLFNENVVQSNRLEKKYLKYDKSKKINNYIYSQLLVNF